MHLYTYDNAIKGLTYPRPNAHTPHGQGVIQRCGLLVTVFCFLKGVGHVLPTRSVEEHTETCNDIQQNNPHAAC
jgi:hypothetical protein